MSKALKTELAEEIPGVAYKLRSSSAHFDDLLKKNLRSSETKMRQNISKLDTAISEGSREISRLERKIGDRQLNLSTMEPESSDFKELARNISSLENRKNIVSGELAKKESERALLSSLHEKAINNPKELLLEINKNSEYKTLFPDLAEWSNSVRVVADHQNKIMNSVSRYLSNDKKFVKEYLTEVKPFLKGDKLDTYANNWILNQKNFNKLEEMKRNKKFHKILQDTAETKGAVRSPVDDLSPSSLSKTLKVGGGIAASVVAPMAVMMWFDDTSDDVAGEAKGTLPGLQGLGAKNPNYARLVEQSRVALMDTNEAVKEANQGLGGNNPGQAVEKYVKRLQKNKAIIDQSLQNWDKVVASSDDPVAAQKAGQSLQQTSKAIEEALTKAGVVAQQTPALKAQPPQQKIAPTRNLISDLQTFIRDSSRFRTQFFDVAPSGVIDNPTIKALRAIESEMNSYTNSGMFTNLLYDPTKNHVIQAYDLKKLEDAVF